MATDASIILGVKPADIQNPIDVATKAMTLKNLSAQSQANTIALAEKTRAYNDETAVRNAYSNNLKPDGSVDQVGVLSELNKYNPLLGQKIGLQFKQNELDNITRDNDLARGIVARIVPGDQDSLDKAHLAAKRANLPDLEQHLGTNANAPGFGDALQQLQMKTFSAPDQLKQANTTIDQHQKKVDSDLKRQQLQQSHDQFIAAHQQEANNSFAAANETSKQRPDVKTALNDTLQQKKFNELLAPYVSNPKVGPTVDDLQKVPLQVMRLAVTEGTKMSKGGVAGEGETAENMPDTRKQKMAEFVQNTIKGKPSPANAGEQLKLYSDYVNGLGGIANDVIGKAYDENLAQHQEFMSPNSVAVAKSIGKQRFTDQAHAEMKAAGDKSPGTSTDKIDHGDALATAQAWLKDPKRSAADKDVARRAIEKAQQSMVGKQ